MRPYLSDNGPHINELVLTKIKNMLIDRFTHHTEQLSCSLIVGKAGRYRSVDNGGKEAINATNTIIIKPDSCFGLSCVS